MEIAPPAARTKTLAPPIPCRVLQHPVPQRARTPLSSRVFPEMAAAHQAATVLTTTTVPRYAPIMSLRPEKPAMAIVPPRVMMGLSAPPIPLAGILRVAIPFVVSRILPLVQMAMGAARVVVIIITMVIAHPPVATV